MRVAILTSCRKLSLAMVRIIGAIIIRLVAAITGIWSIAVIAGMTLGTIIFDQGVGSQ